MQIANGFKDWFDNIMGFLGDILSAVGSMASDILSGIRKLLKELFVPADGFLDDGIRKLKDSFGKKLGADGYADLLDCLNQKAVNGFSFSDSFSLGVGTWSKYLPAIKNGLRVFFYPLIILGDVRFVIWLVRGSSSMNADNG